ncbi:MAG: RluA family pseudouridine synthase [Chloroflexota bacterium]|nr:RluA family pseudouridine synthase [Chloroflexota bacterium]
MSGDSRLARLIVPPDAKGERLDKWVAQQLPDLSRSQVSRLLGEGAIRLDGAVPYKGGVKLSGGESLEVQLPEEAPEEPEPEAMALDVIYQDEQVVVVNKPAGMVVHPAPGHTGGTLVNALLAHFNIDDPEQPKRPGIVHRLDRDTSGVLIAAKNAAARRFLQKQFRRRSTEKEYIALVLGHPETMRGTIKGPIGRHPTHRQKRALVPEGRPATTHYETIEEFDDFTLLRVTPITGRTHQIRVHLDAISVPVVGDELYGPRRRRIPELDRHFLHAAKLTITTPDEQRRTFEAGLPEELERVLDQLRGAGSARG